MRVMPAREDERIIGVLMFHESVADSLIIIDYVACTTDVRVEGIALRKLIGQVRARAASIGIESVVFELEDPSALKAPDVDRARARVRKFQAFGGRTITGVRYLAPDMDNFGGGTETPLLLMYVAHGVPRRPCPGRAFRKSSTSSMPSGGGTGIRATTRGGKGTRCLCVRSLQPCGRFGSGSSRELRSRRTAITYIRSRLAGCCYSSSEVDVYVKVNYIPNAGA